MSDILKPNADSTFRLTAEGHGLMMRALRSSTKFLGFIPRAKARAQHEGDDNG